MVCSALTASFVRRVVGRAAAAGAGDAATATAAATARPRNDPRELRRRAGGVAATAHAASRPFFVGLDVSTTSTGVTVLDRRGRVLACDAVRPRASLSLLEKSRMICARLRRVRETLEGRGARGVEWFVVMEDSAKRWASGKGGASGLMTLAMLNSIVSYECLAIFGSHPTAVHPSVARSYVGVPSFRGGGARGNASHKAKEAVLDLVLRGTPSFPLRYARDSAQWMCKTNFDLSDSHLLALQSMGYYFTAAALNNDVVRDVLRLDYDYRQHGKCDGSGPKRNGNNNTVDNKKKIKKKKKKRDCGSALHTQRAAEATVSGYVREFVGFVIVGVDSTNE